MVTEVCCLCLNKREDAMDDLGTSLLILKRAEVSDADVCTTSESLLGSTSHTRRFWIRRFQTDVRHHLQWILIIDVILDPGTT